MMQEGNSVSCGVAERDDDQGVTIQKVPWRAWRVSCKLPNRSQTKDHFAPTSVSACHISRLSPPNVVKAARPNISKASFCLAAWLRSGSVDTRQPRASSGRGPADNTFSGNAHIQDSMSIACLRCAQAITAPVIPILAILRGSQLGLYITLLDCGSTEIRHEFLTRCHGDPE